MVHPAVVTIHGGFMGTVYAYKSKKEKKNKELGMMHAVRGGKRIVAKTRNATYQVHRANGKKRRWSNEMYQKTMTNAKHPIAQQWVCGHECGLYLCNVQHALLYNMVCGRQGGILQHELRTG